MYERAGQGKVRPRFAAPLLHLDRHGPSTVTALAQHIEVTHSAMSQTVAAMARAGLVELTMGSNARTLAALTDEARAVLPFVRAEWRATEATVRAFDAEVPDPLLRVVADLRAALQQTSFVNQLARCRAVGQRAGKGPSYAGLGLILCRILCPPGVRQCDPRRRPGSPRCARHGW